LQRQTDNENEEENTNLIEQICEIIESYAKQTGYKFPLMKYKEIE
jgi:hypothetical protein